jgi:outer membrane lipoprotein-sorting protein
LKPQGESERKHLIVNKFLRTASMRRLLAAVAGVVVAIGGGTAIALAATSGGPVPPHKRLAAAIHQALAAKPVEGISADINFTNNLIPSFELQGTDPLLNGGPGHIWVSNDGRLRIELYNDSGPGDPEIVVNRNTWWIYDPTLNTVYRGRISQSAPSGKHTQAAALPTVAQIQADLNRLAAHLHLSGAQPGDTGGRPTYTVTVSPKHDGGLLGGLQLAWDAYRGVPLRFAVYQAGGSEVLGVTATNVSYGRISPGVFNLSPPKGPHVVNVAMATPSQSSAGKRGKRHRAITGVRAVAGHLSFRLAAPASLAGLPRQSVSLLDAGGRHGALITYGQNLGGIAVIEEPATAGSRQAINLSSGSGDHVHGITLPSVRISLANGQQVSGQELDTALGTIIRFTSGNVTYTVLASLKPAIAQTAAQGL